MSKHQHYGRSYDGL